MVSGTTYVLTFRAAGTNTGTITPSNLQVYTSDVRSNKDYFNFNSSDFTGTKERILSIETETTKVWENYEVEFTASDATKYITFFVPLNRQTIYLDDVVLTAKDGSETPNVPVVTNPWYDGGFDNVTVNSENHALDDEYRNFSGNWATRVSTETTSDGGTNNYLFMSGSDHPVMNNLQSLNLDPTRTYIFSVKLKNNKAGTQAYLQVCYHATTASTSSYPSSWTYGNVATFTATDELQTYTFEIPAGVPANYIYIRPWNAAANAAGGSIAIDDISVVPVNQSQDDTISPTIDLAKPVANASPQTSVTGTGYTGTVTWSPTVTDKFDYGTVYTATVTITTTAGYTTTGVAENGYVIENATVTNVADSNIVSAVFPATKAEPAAITTLNINKWTGTTAAETFDFADTAALRTKYNNTWQTIISVDPQDAENKVVSLREWGWLYPIGADYNIEADRPVDISFKYYAVSGTLSVRLNQVIDSELGNVVAYFTTTKNAWTDYSKTIVAKDSYTHNGSLAWAGGEDAVLNNIFLRIWGSGEIYIDDLAVVPHYKVTYDANGGEGAPANEYFLARTYTVNNTVTPTKSGYEFKGWAIYADATADDVVTTITTTPGNDIVLYAVWETE